MKKGPSGIVLAPTDLSNHLGCGHLTELNLSALRGEIKSPAPSNSFMDVLAELGQRHESAYLNHLKAMAPDTIEFNQKADPADTLTRTATAIANGGSVIYQGALQRDGLFGKPDYLVRTSDPSQPSYEVYDAKLTGETRAETILQLCAYSWMLADQQGGLPEMMHVVHPGNPFQVEAFRVLDYMAYFRFALDQLRTAILETPAKQYPYPVERCEVCRWWAHCDAQRRKDDHLSLVAGLTRLQMKELERRKIGKLPKLARVKLPWPFKPERGSREAFERVREQARLQLESRQTQTPVFEMLSVQPGAGLCLLPEPSPGDIFFDIEGYVYVADGGFEYLFGYVSLKPDNTAEYTALWALDAAQERQMFEAFIDHVCALRNRFPNMHVYHYAPYEPSAIKRLMGRYATRETQVDALLRGGVFVDLYGIAKQSLRAGIEKYSIKNLEVFYGFIRNVSLRDASTHLRIMERLLELGGTADLAETQKIVQGYNNDDCTSTHLLRNWLEVQRTEQIRAGIEVPRPQRHLEKPVDETNDEVAAVQAQLLVNMPEEANQRTPEQHGFFILAHLLRWHKREDKSVWWDFFRMSDLPDEDLIDEGGAIGGMRFVERLSQGQKGGVVDRYSFPAQDTSIRDGQSVAVRGTQKFGDVVTISFETRTLDIQKNKAHAEEHPASIFAFDFIPARVLENSLLSVARHVAAHGFADKAAYRAARNLLLPGKVFQHPGLNGQSELAIARQAVNTLNGTVFPIQGPPGAGKTYTGGKMICDLVKMGKKVGITAASHKVIRNLLDETLRAAEDAGLSVRAAQKVSEVSSASQKGLREETSNERIQSDLAGGFLDVVGGTAWLWARPEMQNSVDVLFIDEAGQMPLANAMAVAPAGASLVLLGDPQQLAQPSKGTHPDGVDASALGHILQGHKTIPSDRGLFLSKTYRLHPAICSFTSEVFYEDRLSPVSGTANQSLIGPHRFKEPGLYYVPATHSGNRNSAPEEIEHIQSLMKELLRKDARFRSQNGEERRLTLEDILIVAPYNVHVADIRAKLPGARVGTVDKFQGQEAPVVIYSMATSSPEDAPRGMEFLYSLNRLNVAISRAQCTAILIASPLLFAPPCNTPRKLLLANAFCRFKELAHLVQ